MSVVKNYMRKDISTVSAEASATDASKKMAEDKVGYVIVLDGGKPVGMVTERDLVTKVFAKEKNPGETKVTSFMSTPLVTIDPDDSIDKAVETMAKHGFRRLPVVKENIIYGIFTARDVLAHFDEFEKKLVNDLVRWGWGI